MIPHLARGEAIHHRSHSAGLYPFEALVEPIRSRWRFHFESDRPTNRLDKVRGLCSDAAMQFKAETWVLSSLNGLSPIF